MPPNVSSAKDECNPIDEPRSKLPRSAGVFVRRYVVVDTRGQTRSLTAEQLRQRHVLLDLYGQDETYLREHYPQIIDGQQTGEFDVNAAADFLKRQALYNSYRVTDRWNTAMINAGLRV